MLSKVRIYKIIYATSYMVALSGCNTPNIVNRFDEASKSHLCQLNRTRLISENPGIYPALTIQKNNGQTLSCWITFTPENATQVPLKETALIIKVKQKNNSQEEFNLKGEHLTFGHFFFDKALNEFKAKGKEARTKDHTPYNPEEMATADMIWPINRAHLDYAFMAYKNEHAVYFNISTDFFLKLKEASDIETLIQTSNEPIKVYLKQEQINFLKEFQNSCLKQTSTKKLVI
jgi:hypothetical protein